MIFSFFIEFQELLMGETKAPGPVIVSRPIGDGRRHFRQGMEVQDQFVVSKRPFERNAVIHKMDIVLLEIDQAVASGIIHIGVPYIPFIRNGPVITDGSGGDFMELKVRDLAQQD